MNSEYPGFSTLDMRTQTAMIEQGHIFHETQFASTVSKPMSHDLEAAQAFAAAHDPLTETQTETIEHIKAEAGRIILGRFPEWQQRNMIAAAVNLERKERLSGLTTEEQAAIADLTANWAWVDAVRDYSNVLAGAVVAALTVEAVEAIAAGVTRDLEAI
ncbi:hypothetical protein [Paremcibacter congregatus]|uniref:hypothetical protein n=1 Tax=Paremcibacter congregatus TaxID=2043170 RepID=UPI0030EF6B10